MAFWILNMARKITAIQVQKKNPNRVNIYLDGEFAFGLARLVAAWLQINQELTEDQISALQCKDTDEVAFQEALHFLSYRPRTAAELDKKLTDKGYSETVITQTLQRLQESGLIGDADFARAWVESRSTFRPRSRRAIHYELRQKGVADDVIQQALEEMPAEEETAYQAGQRYCRRLAGLDRNEFRTRLSGFLARRGFTYQTIQPVVQRLWSEQSLGNAADSMTTEE